MEDWKNVKWWVNMVLTSLLVYTLFKWTRRLKWNSEDVCQNFSYLSMIRMSSCLNWTIVLNTRRTFPLCAHVCSSHGSGIFQRQQERTNPNLHSFSSLCLNHVCLHLIGQSKSHGQSQNQSGQTLKITGQPYRLDTGMEIIASRLNT